MKKYFYVWDETLASKRSQEIASYLVKHIKFIATNKDKIISYSDSCTEQNLNIKIVLYLLKVMILQQTNILFIGQKFLI